MDNVNQEVPQEQPIQPEIQPQPTNNNHWLKTLNMGLGVIGIGIIIGIGGFMLVTKNNRSSIITSVTPTITQPSPTSLPTEASAKAGDPTANWKTYVSKGYEFKYPLNGHVVTDNSSGTYISYEDGTKPYFTFTVAITDNPSHLTNKQVVEKMVNDLKSNKNPETTSQADQTLQTMKEYSNGQIIGIKLQSFDEGYPQRFGEVVEATENKIFKFYIGDGSGGGVSDNDEKRLDQILSTFKFTN